MMITLRQMNWFTFTSKINNSLRLSMQTSLPVITWEKSEKFLQNLALRTSTTDSQEETKRTREFTSNTMRKPSIPLLRSATTKRASPAFRSSWSEPAFPCSMRTSKSIESSSSKYSPVRTCWLSLIPRMKPQVITRLMIKMRSLVVLSSLQTVRQEFRSLQSCPYKFLPFIKCQNPTNAQLTDKKLKKSEPRAISDKLSLATKNRKDMS